MNDKRFWQGAAVGAAAALLLSNAKVRGKLTSLISGTGNMVKSSSSAVKQTASHTAVSVKENVATGGEIFRDTYIAGKQGFKESVERHRQVEEPAVEVAEVVEERPLEAKPAQAE